MHVKRLSGNCGRTSDLGADRAVITAVVLAVTTVLLLIGFAGPSVYFTLPGPLGWLYIGVVIIAASVTLVWLFCVNAQRKRQNPSRSKRVSRGSKRMRLV
jgi:uncharacterized RDD family membrane protein YckC